MLRLASEREPTVVTNMSKRDQTVNNFSGCYAGTLLALWARLLECALPNESELYVAGLALIQSSFLFKGWTFRRADRVFDHPVAYR